MTPARTVTLRDGRRVTLEPLAERHLAALGAFLRSLPELDRLFFTRDVTSEDVLRGYVHHTGPHRTVGIVAAANGEIAGFAYVRQNRVAWLAHVGDVVAVVGTSIRHLGLGTAMIREALILADDLHVEKAAARIVIEDRDSVRVFEKLGFRYEGTLLNHARAADGTTYDLAAMGLDLRKARAALRTAPDAIDLSRR